MIIRDIPKSFNPVINFGYKNLLVSGSSFTYNNSDQHMVSWPYYLRDLGQFQQVLDCSCRGAGNKHIHDSIILKIETNLNITSENTFIVVMWTGYDKDDFIVDPIALKNNYSDHYAYTDSARVGMTGGLTGESNLIVSVENLKKIKSNHTRSIESYIWIVGLYNYLIAKNFKFVFVECSTPGTKRDTNFEIADYLEPPQADVIKSLLRTITPNLGDYAEKNTLNSVDGYHPMPDDHLGWTKEVLLPYLTANFNTI
jgi:hypothetical protein